MQAPGDARPRFRQDLIAELIEDQGARFIDVMDPDSNHVFRFYEVEYSLACAMDGERDVAGIVKWAQEELGVTPSPKEVQSVIATLVDLRFIDDGKAAVAADAKVAKAAPTQPEVPVAKPAEKPVAKSAEKPVAKQPAVDDELARGVVVGAKVAPRVEAPAPDLELGASGAKAQPKPAELPKAAEFDLGAPGASPVAAHPKAPVEDIALGASGSRAEAPKAKPAPASEIGMDLSAHMGVGADDVKEAVRKSKAMSAVDVPKELLEAEAPKAPPEKQPVAKQPEPSAKGEQKQPAAKSAAEKQAQSERDKKAAADKKAQAEKDKQAAAAAEKQPEAKKADKAQDKADKKADKSEKKADKAQDKATADRAAANKSSDKTTDQGKRPGTKEPVAPPAPSGGVSPILVVMLILAIVGAATFFVWKFVLSEPDAPPPKTSSTPPKPLPPPPPAAVTSKLAVEDQAPQVVKAPVDGTIETIEAADKDVKTGDVIATLAGGKPLMTEIGNLTKQLEQGQPALDAATKALEEAQQQPDNAAGVTAAQAKLDRLKKPLDDKKTTLDKKQADLEKLQIKATADGKLAEVATVGQKVALDAPIASIVRPSLMIASFKVPPGTKMAPDGSLSVVAGDKTLVCTVVDAQAETVKVSCPPDGLAAGADVKFTLPK